MAEPTDEEVAARLVAQFDAYVVEVKRLMKGAATAVKHALNSARINGYTLADLIAMIRAEVKTHEDDPNNPHADTLSALQGMSTTEFETKAGLYFPKDALPITQVPSLPLSTAGNRLTIGASSMIFMGRRVQLPAITSGEMAPVNQYLKLTISGKQPDRVPSYSLVQDGGEDLYTMIVASIQYANGVWTPSAIPGVRIGPARLSVIPHGKSIPVSGGTQASPGSIDGNWIG